MTRSLTIPALFAALVMAGCGDNPAENVTKAPVSDAKPLPTSSAKVSDAATSAPVGKASESMPGALVIATESSKIEFVGSKKVGGAHNGGFKAFKGLFELVAGKPEVKVVDVEIDTTTIYADDPKLTEHLKNKDFFEVDKYPTAKFVTTEIKAGGEKGATHTLVGNLTLHGTTKSITIPATVKVEGDTVTLKSEFVLNKNDFGITFSGPGGVIREDVLIKLDIKAAKKI